jgi:hypothetical protein
LTRAAPSERPRITGRLGLAFACLSILLTGAAAGCGSGSSPAPGAATNLDNHYGVEDPTAVSCPSASFCMAVLESGYAATYDGTRWSRPARLSSSAGEPDSVSCPTVSFCMAVDARDSSAFQFNGSTWASASSINDPASSTQPGMASVSCSSPRFCAAVDNGSNAFTFNGTSWSPAAVIDPGNELSTVSCPSARFCAAVDYGPNVVTFNGTAWSKPFAIDPAGYLQAVSCAAAGFCVAVDRKGNALTFDGSTWSAPVNADPNGLSMGEGGISWPVVSCPTSHFCAAVDGNDGDLVTFDGSSWTAPVTIDSKAANSDQGPVLVFLMSVSCPSARLCVAGDTVGDVFVRG